jgi:ATP-dependent DNA ligase
MTQTIYKKDSKGKLRFLTIRTEGNKLFQESGLLDTDSPIIHSKECKGKNIGKVNETTDYEQCLVEAEAMIAIKLKEDYYPTQEEALNGEKLFPMLAKDFEKEKKKIDWDGDVFIQAKLDGMRCLSTVKNGEVEMLSRDGKTITTLPHILDALSELPDGVYDGELYSHGKNFQENMRLIKKWREESFDVWYHIYDFVSAEKFKNRSNHIKSLNLNLPLKTVETFEVNREDLERIHINFVQEGYEGSIVRHGDEGYKLNGRSSNLLKKKDFDDVALPLIDVVPGIQRPEWGTPVFDFKGKRNEAGTRLTHEERVDLLKNKADYIGKTCEVRYFGVSEEGVMRFPVFVGFRLDK